MTAHAFTLLAMDAPVAYFLTFRTYGTWLPGDERGFVDHRRDGEDSWARGEDERRAAQAGCFRRWTERVFGNDERACVNRAMETTCQHRGWTLFACNVRTNHVHVVVSAAEPPERVMVSLKAWATRGLRDEGLVGPEDQVWSRHGSTRYLRDVRAIEAAREYVVNGQ
jgi:REP element-mobilizing transposase RayT